MPTISARDIEVQRREADARVKIAVAVRDADLTLTQVVHLLATMLADYAKRLEANECRELDDKERG